MDDPEMKEPLWGPCSCFLVEPDLPPREIVLSGRQRWALEALMAAGSEGCSPIDRPAPRWSSYVHRLRRIGIGIETKWHENAGPFEGRHGRYVLVSSVARRIEVAA